MTRDGQLWDAVPEDEYHMDPALSSTMARLLVPPSTPAHYRWTSTHPRPANLAFDLGHLVHTGVLGVGAGLVVVEGNRNRNDVKAALAEARAAGLVPVKPDEAEAVAGAVAAVQGHEVAGPLFADGVPEQSGWWTDPETGVGCKFRPDWLTILADGRVCAVDLKTTDREHGASAAQFARSVASYRYHGQADWYLTGLAACGLTDVAWLWVVVEVEPPHLVAVHAPDQEDLAAAAAANAAARRLLADCRDRDEWPGYPAEISTLRLPRWAS